MTLIESGREPESWIMTHRFITSVDLSWPWSLISNHLLKVWFVSKSAAEALSLLIEPARCSWGHSTWDFSSTLDFRLWLWLDSAVLSDRLGCWPTALSWNRFIPGIHIGLFESCRTSSAHCFRFLFLRTLPFSHRGRELLCRIFIFVGSSC